MNALQWAGVVAALVALIACVLAVVAPKDSEQRAVATAVLSAISVAIGLVAVHNYKVGGKR